MSHRHQSHWYLDFVVAFLCLRQLNVAFCLFCCFFDGFSRKDAPWRWVYLCLCFPCCLWLWSVWCAFCRPWWFERQESRSQLRCWDPCFVFCLTSWARMSHGLRRQSLAPDVLRRHILRSLFCFLPEFCWLADLDHCRWWSAIDLETYLWRALWHLGSSNPDPDLTIDWSGRHNLGSSREATDLPSNFHPDFDCPVEAWQPFSFPEIVNFGRSSGSSLGNFPSQSSPDSSSGTSSGFTPDSSVSGTIEFDSKACMSSFCAHAA